MLTNYLLFMLPEIVVLAVGCFSLGYLIGRNTKRR